MANLYNNIPEVQEYIQTQLATFRNKKNMTQVELANLIDVSPKTISDIETNRRGISLQTLIKICNVLRLDIKKVFDEK